MGLAVISRGYVQIVLSRNSHTTANGIIDKQRWMFIVEGAITVVLGFFAYPLLPNYPSNTKWLNESERALAQYRLSLEVDGDTDEVEESVFVGLKQAASDPKTWLLVLILTSAVVSMSFTCEYYLT